MTYHRFLPDRRNTRADKELHCSRRLRKSPPIVRDVVSAGDIRMRGERARLLAQTNSDSDLVAALPKRKRIEPGGRGALSSLTESENARLKCGVIPNLV